MTLANIIDNVAKWAQAEICDGMQLKMPDDDANDGDYPGELITPVAFACFAPAKDRLPPGIRAPIPSICAQIVDGKDDLLTGKRIASMRLSIAAWNPGVHGTEIMVPVADATQLGGRRYLKIQSEEDKAAFQRNMDGWRDAWGFADRALSALENTEFIAGLRLVKEAPDGIRYGPYKQDDQIWDFYPYWFLWIDFDLEAGLVHRVPDAYKNLL